MKYYLNAESPKKTKGPEPKRLATPVKKPSFFHKHKLGLTLLLLLLLVPTLVWYLLPNYQLKKAIAVQDHLIQLEENDAPKEERKAVEKELSQLKRNLSPAERKVLRQEEERRETVKLKEFAAMSLEERNYVIDLRLQKEEERRRKEEAKREQQAANNPGKPGKEAGQQGAENGGNAPPGGFPAGQQVVAQGGGGDGKGKPPQTPEQRDLKMRDKLSDTTPETRGLKFLMEVENQRRRAELGLPPGKGRGGP